MFNLYNKLNSEKKRNFLAVVFGIIFWILSWSISEKNSGYRRGDLFRDISEHLLENFFNFFKIWDRSNFLFITLMNMLSVFFFIFYLSFLIYLSFSLANIIITWRRFNKEKP
ncbi:MAG: hypothetical protein AD073_000309 [Mycoplasmataceae bacterium]|nr:MAG: hypothetical protein AD073_000309 [Mycoplasmataceae bacterium]